MEPLLEVRNLKKYFEVREGMFKKSRQYVKAVDGVDFTIAPGETFGLVGESGCGKSTVGRLILRLIEATEGEVLFNGTDICSMNKQELLHIRKNLQIVFQDPYGSLNPRMTAAQIISEPMLKHRLVSRDQVKQETERLLSIVGLNKADGSKYPHEFSGGQRQRIVIARALSLNPKLIVCDEPVSALDVSIQAQVLNLLKQLQNDFGIAYLFIAHGMAVVQHISHRIGVMYLGKLVEVAESDQLFNNSFHPYTKALMSAIPIPDPEIEEQRQQIPVVGEMPNPISPPSGCRFHPRCPFAKPICSSEEPVLRTIEGIHQVACHFAGNI